MSPTRFARALLIATSGVVFMTASSSSVLLAQKPAPAQDTAMTRARAHYAKAQRLFNLRKFASALPEYEAAFQAKPLPAFLFNIGQCHRNLNNYGKAIFSFRRYLTLVPGASNRVQIEKLIDELEEKKRKRDTAARNAANMLRPKPTTPATRSRSTPFYRRWWFWTGVGAAVAGTGAVLVLSGGGTGVPGSDLGNVDFGK